MSKRGFTLIEVLVVIVIISLLTVIAIPASQGVNKKIKEKLYTSKLTLAEQGAALWGEDHESCFTCSGVACSSECNNLTCHTEFENEKICEIKFSILAENNYFKYDNEPKKLIEDPRNKNALLNDQTITIIFNKKNKTVNTNLGNYSGYYSLSFNGNGATSGTMSIRKCPNNVACLLPNNNFVRNNYDFSGWSLTSGGNVQYSNGSTIKITKNTTIYAKWDLKKYNLLFNGNGATSGSMSSIVSEYGKSFSLPNNTFNRTGYTFIGWSTSSNGSVIYKNLSSIILTNNTILYAQWKIIDSTPPTVTFATTSPLLPGTMIYNSPASVKITASDNMSGVKSVRYCTTTGTICTPSSTITNGSTISVTGSTTSALDRTICANATDNANNVMSSPTCKTYKIDNLNPSVSCSSTGAWSKTTSVVNCTGTDYSGIRKLEWSPNNSTWTTFSSINANGPFSTPYSASFNTNVYSNYIKVTDTVGRTYTRTTYSMIDNLTPFPPSMDIQGTLANTSSNIRDVSCTNNMYLSDGNTNPAYNKNDNTICRLYYKDYYTSYTWYWYWSDDWTGDSGYSGVDYLTYNGSCSSSKYTGGSLPCTYIGSGQYLNFYSVDAAGNKSPTYLRIYAP